MGLELADIFNQYGPAYRQKYADQLLPSHRQAMRAIEQYRTDALAGRFLHALNAVKCSTVTIPAAIGTAPGCSLSAVPE